jgi:hypothetical protein
MNEHDFSAGGKSQRRKANHATDEEVQYTLSSEEQVLRSISSRVPLPKVLNEICSVLDCQIGNVVSLISLPGDDLSDLPAIAKTFGLYSFCSEGLVDEDGVPVGLLAMYCSVARSPNVSEFQLIERVKCLAAIAIKRLSEASEEWNCGRQGNKSARGPLLEWPVSMT